TEETGEENVPARASGIFGRNGSEIDVDEHQDAHDGLPPVKSKIVDSEGLETMSTTRQSAHICRRLAAASPPNIEWPASLPSIRSVIWRVPNGLPHAMQTKGCASLSTAGVRVSSLNTYLGSRVIACSGQVFTHRPHCTQLRSMIRNCGESGLSSRADSGQAPMHAKHKVHASRRTFKVPNSAPGGRATLSGTVSPPALACSDRWSTANSIERRLSSDSANTAGWAIPIAGARSNSASIQRGSAPSSTEKCVPR